MSWGDAASWITAVVAIAALAGSYVQFVLKPSFLPSAEFDVDFLPLYRDGEYLYGEVAERTGPATMGSHPAQPAWDVCGRSGASLGNGCLLRECPVNRPRSG
jgi:hypothetical protein